MEAIENPKVQLNGLDIDYEKIREDNSLSDLRDIVWIKFTTMDT